MTSKNVLIVEDHSDTANLIGLHLTRYGWTFECATTFKDGVLRANRCPFPEVISLDLNLPDSGTWETIPRIPEMMRNGPVIVQSNEDRKDVRDAVEKLGAVFVVKDFGEDYPVRLFTNMVDAVEIWRDRKVKDKKATSRIQTNLLQMAATDSAMNAIHAR